MRNQYKALQEAYEQVVEGRPRVLSPEEEDFIVNVFTQGIEQGKSDFASQRYLADLAGVTRGTIYNLLKKRGLLNLIPRGQKLDPSGSRTVYGNQKVTPDQEEYIYNLAKVRLIS